MNSINVSKLNYFYGEGTSRTQVLFNNNLLVTPSELVVMTGPSGSGKTTLLTLIGAIRNIQEGNISVLGTSLANLHDTEIINIRRKIGFIFQSHNLFESLTAIENVMMACHLNGLDQEEAHRCSAKILKRVGLAQHMNHKPQALSGGQRQRVAVARALVNHPKLILADEPTASLDKASSLEIGELLKEWAVRYQSTIILVTHDSRILEFADRIVNMVDGAIVSDVFVDEALLVCKLLRSFHFFSSYSISELSLIYDKMQLRTFQEGDVLVRQGDQGEEFFLIRDGSVCVYVSGEPNFSTLGQGDFFGERALLSGDVRAATIVGREPGRVYVLNKLEFIRALEACPSFNDQIRSVYFQK